MQDLIINENSIKDKIYTIRNMQVMLDRDLAELYGIKSIRLREQVKRNMERFPSDFMFQLDELKERLGILKFWLGVIVGVFTAVFGWIVTTYKTQDTILLIIATIFLLGLLIAFFKLNQNIEKKLKEIRDTKK